MEINNKITKFKLSIAVFLAILISFFSFFSFPREAKADATMLVYSLMTPDPTPLIKGTVSDAEAQVFVVVEGYEAQEAAVSDDGSWSLQFNETLAAGTHSVGAAATVDGEIISDLAFIYINDEYPIELYFEIDFEILGELSVSSFSFTDEYTYASDDGDFSFTFPAGVVVTKTGGGTFSLENWHENGVDPDNERLILQLRFGVSDIGLDFSKEVTITFIVGEQYDGQTLNVFTKSEGSGDDGWEPMDISCVVASGQCSFSTSHASYFGISEYTSLMDDEDENENEKAYISSWKAYRYEHQTSRLCKNKLRLVIKGKHFDKKAEVRIGDKKAYSVDRKSSNKIVAKFCMKDLLKVKTGNKRMVKVINPDADTEKADKKINLKDIF